MQQSRSTLTAARRAALLRVPRPPGPAPSDQEARAGPGAALHRGALRPRYSWPPASPTPSRRTCWARLRRGQSQGWHYFLHYSGWNKKYDEWVEESGLVNPNSQDAIAANVSALSAPPAAAVQHSGRAGAPDTLRLCAGEAERRVGQQEQPLCLRSATLAPNPWRSECSTVSEPEAGATPFGACCAGERAQPQAPGAHGPRGAAGAGRGAGRRGAGARPGRRRRPAAPAGRRHARGGAGRGPAAHPQKGAAPSALARQEAQAGRHPWQRSARLGKQAAPCPPAGPLSPHLFSLPAAPPSLCFAVPD